MADPLWSVLGIDGFKEILCNTDYDELSRSELAEMFGVKPETISSWRGRVNWEEITTERRKRYANLKPRVDNALFKATQKGDVNAIRTFYERFDAWTPASKVLNEHSISEAEIDEALNGLIERKRAAIKSLDESGRADSTPADGREVEKEAGRADEVLPAQPSPTEIH